MFVELVTAVGHVVTLNTIAGAAVGGLFTLIGAYYAAQHSRQLAHEAHVAKVHDEEKEARDREADALIRRELAQSENLTQRFKTLMDGYESRITDLTTEVQTLRRAVDKLQATLDAHRQVCANCPHFKDHYGAA